MCVFVFLENVHTHVILHIYVYNLYLQRVGTHINIYSQPYYIQMYIKHGYISQIADGAWYAGFSK